MRKPHGRTLSDGCGSSAQDGLEQQAARLTATGDPVASTVAAYAAAVGAQHRLIVDANLTAAAHHEATAQLIQEARKPWSRDEMRTLITELSALGRSLTPGATCIGCFVCI
jgi:hydroxyethylthiazole kinase-like sugar kinase family protein